MILRQILAKSRSSSNFLLLSSLSGSLRRNQSQMLLLFNSRRMYKNIPLRLFSSYSGRGGTELQTIDVGSSLPPDKVSDGDEDTSSDEA